MIRNPDLTVGVEEMPGQPPPSPWRHRLRFSVRGLILLVLILGVAMGWIAHFARNVRVQREALTAVDKAYGSVVYDWQFEGGRFRLKKGTNIISDAVPWWPRWLVDRLGVDCFGHVTHVRIGYAPTPNPDHLEEALAHVGCLDRLKEVRLEGQPVTDAALAHLGGLIGLQVLILDDTRVTDAGLRHLEGMTGLEGLGLVGNRISDAGLAHLGRLSRLESLGLGRTSIGDDGLVYLKGLAGLKCLDLSETRVSDAGLGHLKALTGLDVLGLRGTRVTDVGLRRLEGLTELRLLNLTDTRVTDDGVRDLQRLWPKLKITR